MYYFDQFGYVSATPIVGRETTIPPCQCDSPLVPNFTGDRWVCTEHTYPAPASANPPPPRKIILTKLEYMNRFTDGELAAIYTAAKTVVSVEIWLEKFKLASEINLDDPATIAGLQAMETTGLLAAGRSTEIIA